jgi:dipeptidyl aminopeptidase/acylaminoacyl peptidase
MDAISPIKAVSRVQAPILILNNDSDDGTQSRNMAGALKGAGKDVTLIVKDYDYNQAQRVAKMNTVAAFLKQHNPPA